MKITQFRVTNFRSVDDSGWLDVGEVSALIGTNESGKTNLLVPLWKLKPAKNGEIKPTADYPRKKYNEFRVMEKKPIFIRARFELSPTEKQKVVELSGALPEDAKFVEIARDFDGKHYVTFILGDQSSGITGSTVDELLGVAESDIKAFNVESTEADQRDAALRALAGARSKVGSNDLNEAALKEVITALDAIKPKRGPVQGVVGARVKQVFLKLEGIARSLKRLNPNQSQEARNYVIKCMPAFVYYSNYGNLDSEIYLPHVIENLTRTDLGSKEEAKSRTLKVLFEFVKLKPSEIQELGKDFQRVNNVRANDEQVAAIAEKKKERDILLQSASTELTGKFRAWWKQGEYRFRFQADGDHFRIWVSDDKRPEDIELEGRSTGLQWFLSFYLIFLVESRDSHQGAILLLDEPGLSLHPLAQRDLADFFENLAKTNQILYTTHSPFLVDPDHLDRVKAVYVDANGLTAVSSDLRVTEKLGVQKTRSIYPVYAALGLSASETLLQGCQIVIVEGTSDQLALSAMKAYLVGHGLITPKRDIVFIPSGGVRGITAMAGIISAPTDEMPFTLLDNDSAGREMAKKLRAGLYAADPGRAIVLNEKAQGDTELEDYWPKKFLAELANRLLRGPDEDFSDTVKDGTPFVNQVEAFATKHGLTLAEGWKVELAKSAKAKLGRDPNTISKDSDEVKKWVALMKPLSE
jgi:energy-coupling factor transporter ATP-binding protein EcfA2